jgi:hypothetical protein
MQMRFPVTLLLSSLSTNPSPTTGLPASTDFVSGMRDLASAYILLSAVLANGVFPAPLITASPVCRQLLVRCRINTEPFTDYSISGQSRKQLDGVFDHGRRDLSRKCNLPLGVTLADWATIALAWHLPEGDQLCGCGDRYISVGNVP